MFINWLIVWENISFIHNHCACDMRRQKCAYCFFFFVVVKETGVF